MGIQVVRDEQREAPQEVMDGGDVAVPDDCDKPDNSKCSGGGQEDHCVRKIVIRSMEQIRFHSRSVHGAKPECFKNAPPFFPLHSVLCDVRIILENAECFTAKNARKA